MTVKTQFQTVKNNWLLVLLLLILIFFPSCSAFGPLRSLQMESFGAKIMGPAIEPSYAAAEYSSRSSYIPPYSGSGDFAPEIKDRVLTKTASLTTEVDKGAFFTATDNIRDIVITSGAYLLNEQVNKHDINLKEYYQATYDIKVETSKYDAVINQLKQIGDIIFLNENTADITGQKVNLQVSLETEKERLKRYKELFAQAQSVEDKINLNDRIFGVEQTIKYLEEALKNIGQQVDYSSIHLTLTEKRSEYADVTLIKFSGMVKSFIRSINGVIWIAVIIIPWVVAFLIIRGIYRRMTHKKR